MSQPSARTVQILRQIAAGGFGTVYLAKIRQLDGFNRLAAVKILHSEWSTNEEIASRMRDEARLLGWLRHKNIVDVIDLTRLDGRVAVLMEYLEAVDCNIIRSHCNKEGSLMSMRAVLGRCLCCIGSRCCVQPISLCG